ncbi:MAG: lysoplasmalogenase [Bacteroidetes bacterium]|nr:lysoplasmalogenase [Bacteroidota bacterium]
MKLTAYLYFLVAAIELYAVYFGQESLQYIAKPLLMPSLIIFYLSGAARPLVRRDALMVAAFVFSCVGDVALMFAHGDEKFFLIGLIGFLVTHLLYIVAFMMVADRSADPVLRHKVWLVVPLATYLGALLAVVFPAVDMPMKVPVAIYSAVIGTMVIFALNRYKRVNDNSFALVFGGALLFMLSDSLIAINKFLCHGTLFMGGMAIMTLYILGQYCIAKGMLWNDKVKLT